MKARSLFCPRLVHRQPISRGSTQKVAGLGLTPPFPSQDLIGIIEAELASTDEEKHLARTLLAAGLPPLANTRVLSFILGISHQLTHAMAHVPTRYYRQFEIKKRAGGSRLISTPRVFLKVVQRWILLNILYKKPLPDYVTGFVPGRGLIANANSHVGQRFLTRLDLEDFFPSIGFQKVMELYANFGFPDSVTALLGGLSVLNGSLPQGAPTSPYLANLAFLPVDSEIAKLAIAQRINYSRYADDLTFSSPEPISESIFSQIQQIILTNSFRINKAKIRVLGPGQRLSTTGMVVNVKPQPVRTLRRRLRVRFHQAALDPSKFVNEANQLQGWAAYVNMYDKNLGRKYLAIAREVRNFATSKDQPPA